VHVTLGMNGYGFSVDDDTADVGSQGSSLELAFGSSAQTAPLTAAQIKNSQKNPNTLANLNYFTTGAPYGLLTDMGQIDNTSTTFANIRTKGYLVPGDTTPTPVTVIKLPTSLIPLLVAQDATTPGALVFSSDTKIQPLAFGTRVLNYQIDVNDPKYPAGIGAV